MDEEQVDELSLEEKEDQEKKAERVKKEREEVLNSALRGQIGNMRERVAFIMNNYVAARNSDIELTWMYWESFESDKFTGNSVNKEEMMELTRMTSITRVRAKIQNEYKLFQANPEVKKFRGIQEESKIQEAIEDKPSYPLYSIYIDETGKTQKYLSVGSLWVNDQRSALFALLRLDEWKRQLDIDYEFHFAKVSKNRLDQYKAFFLKFLTLNPGVGFKVIVIDRSGFQNTNKAITDLTFHLIHKGIKHENDTGRAPLPRILDVHIDNEEKGSDSLKIENLKERLISQNIDGLVINDFTAEDSSDNNFLQVVDLFISSVNRRLHFSDSAGKPKDELADYILDLLQFNIDMVNKANNDIDKSHVFNLTSTVEN